MRADLRESMENKCCLVMQITLSSRKKSISNSSSLPGIGTFSNGNVLYKCRFLPQTLIGS